MTKKPLKVIAGDPKNPLIINDIKIPCFVLENETRVITRNSLSSAFNSIKGGRDERAGAIDKPSNIVLPKNKEESEKNIVNLPRFLTRKWIQPFISDELMQVLNTPLLMDNPYGGGVMYGWDVSILVKICSAILDSKDAGVTTRRQENIVNRASAIMKGIALVGIVALVDEATGYQDIRSKKSLAEILEKFIAKELRPWIKTFPDEFYIELSRLWGYEKPKKGSSRPKFFASLTNKLIYKELAPGVLEELQRLNPILENGNRSKKHHQLLSENFGVIKLREQITRVVTLLEVAQSKDHFNMLYESRYGSGQLFIDFYYRGY